MIKSPASGVYEIFNMVNGRRYIGSTNRLSIRFLQHRSKLRKGTHGNAALQAAWNKYGESAFVYRTIEPCSCDRLIATEQRWLDEIRGNGERPYNIAPFANSGAKGRSPSAKTRTKQSESVRASYASRSKEDTANHVAAIKASWTPERRELVSMQRKLVWSSLTEERRNEIRAARKLGRDSEEARAKQLAGMKALLNNPDFLKKRNEASAAAARRPEVRAKQAENLSKRNKERWSDQEYAAKITAAARISSRSEDDRKRRSDLAKARWADPASADKLRKALQEGREKKKSATSKTP